jgi:hypothetical protein
MHRVGKPIGMAKPIWIAVSCSLFAWSQSQPSAAGPARIAPAHVIVTAGHYYSHEPPVITREDLILTHQFDPLTITNLVPLRGERAALELYVLVDDCSSCEAGTKVDELHRFVASQPATTAVGVAYIQAGQLEIAEKPTRDHARAAAALNAPTGGPPANPFVALADLIERWDREPTRDPQARRALLMISNGIDPAVGEGLLDPSADAAIQAAERSGVTIFAMYHPSADYATTDSAKIYAGQVQLAHVANESGGEAYLMGFGPLPTLAPFLADVADHLANQYRLEFLANPESACGSFEDVMVKTKLPDIELLVPARTWVPGTGAAGEGQ